MQTRKDFTSGRRGSINVSSLAARRRSSVLLPPSVKPSTLAAGGSDAVTAIASTASGREAMTKSLSDALQRRGSAQRRGRRASAFVRQSSHDRTAQGGAPRKASLVAQLDGRPASVPVFPTEGSWSSPALGVAAAPSLPQRRASLLPVKEGAAGRQPLAVIEGENAEKAGKDDVCDDGTTRGRGTVESVENSKGEPFDAGSQLPVTNL